MGTLARGIYYRTPYSVVRSYPVSCSFVNHSVDRTFVSRLIYSLSRSYSVT